MPAGTDDQTVVEPGDGADPLSRSEHLDVLHQRHDGVSPNRVEHVPPYENAVISAADPQAAQMFQKRDNLQGPR